MAGGRELAEGVEDVGAELSSGVGLDVGAGAVFWMGAGAEERLLTFLPGDAWLAATVVGLLILECVAGRCCFGVGAGTVAGGCAGFLWVTFLSAAGVCFVTFVVITGRLGVVTRLCCA